MGAAESSSKLGGSVHDFVVKFHAILLTETLGGITMQDVRGNDVELSRYKGKVLLIVNVASRCGLANSNYTELGQLYEKYREKGFEILAFPCNQFAGQEPDSDEKIVEFACNRFQAEFPIFRKVDVNGNNAAPLYKFLKSERGGLFGERIKWNFTKFLVDKEGHVMNRYAPTWSPLGIEHGNSSGECFRLSQNDIKKLLEV
uniref:Glutathione peroxidase n=1 Tax=Aegilops tauschii TaxID=37682 RepID=M8C0E0_AEGTA